MASVLQFRPLQILGLLAAGLIGFVGPAVLSLHVLVGAASAMFTWRLLQEVETEAPAYTALQLKSKLIQRLISALMIFFAGLAMAFVLVYFLFVMRNTPQTSAYRNYSSVVLSGRVIPYLLANLLTVLLMYILYAIFPTEVLWFMLCNIFVLASVTIRHVYDLTTDSSLLERLKQTEGNTLITVLTFVIAALIEFFTLILCVNSILFWIKGEIFSGANLMDAGSGLIYGNIIDLLKSLYTKTWPGLEVIVFAVVGAIFNWTILETLIEFFAWRKRFARDVNDYTAIARKYVAAEKFAAALKTLNKADASSFFLVRACAYLGLERFDDALADVNTQIHQFRRLPPDQPGDSVVFISLSGISTSFNMPRRAYSRLIQFGIQKRVEDACMAIALEVLCIKIPSEARDDLLLMRTNEALGPLARTYLFLEAKQFDSASQMLIENHVHDVLNCIVYFRLSSFIMANAFSGPSFHENFSNLSSLFMKFVPSIIQQCSQYMCADILYLTMILYWLTSKELKNEHEQGWEYHIDTLKGKAPLSTDTIYFQVLRAEIDAAR